MCRRSKTGELGFGYCKVIDAGEVLYVPILRPVGGAVCRSRGLTVL